MKTLICIVCPRGCHLNVDEENDYKVTGHHCEKGETYGRNEAASSRSCRHSTVKVNSDIHPRCPVKTDQSIPKDDVFHAMSLLDSVLLTPPIRRGDIVVENIAGSGAHFVATRDLDT